VLARKQQQQSMAMRKPLEGLSIQELQQAHSSIKPPSTSSTGPYMENNKPYSNKVSKFTLFMHGCNVVPMMLPFCLC
jgi:hypothetical protein